MQASIFATLITASNGGNGVQQIINLFIIVSVICAVVICSLPKEERRQLWAIGETVRTSPSAMLQRGDDKLDMTVKHNIMSVAVSRYVKQARAIIANTALGQFPNSDL